MTELICIVCPKGCRLKVDEAKEYAVTGYACPRGEVYGREELKNPLRVVTSTVRISGAAHRRCPVKTDGAIPKRFVFEAMRLLSSVDLTSPVKLGQVVIEDICGTGISFVTTRSL